MGATGCALLPAASTPSRPSYLVETPSPNTEGKEPPGRRIYGAGGGTTPCAVKGNVEDDQRVARLQAEVESLKAQVVKLKAENEQLHEHVAQNAALKERY